MSTAVEPAGGGRRAIDALRDQIAPAATDEELLYLAQVGQRLGLDPIAGHVVLISRWDSRLDRNVARPQVTADGRLVLAEATGELDGFDGPEWCGPRNKTGGHDWVEVWDDDDPPHAARVLVYRKGRAHPANGTVRWAEFAQKDRGGNLLPTWAAMPSHMLGKVALNLGLRRAFPGIVPGGLDADDIDSDFAPPAEPPPSPPAKVRRSGKRFNFSKALAELDDDHRAWAKLQARGVNDDDRLADIIERAKALVIKTGSTAWVQRPVERVDADAVPPEVHDDAPEAAVHEDGTERYDPDDMGRPFT